MLASLRAHRLRCYSTSPSSLPPLPPASEWRKIWEMSSARRPAVSVSNPATASRLVDAFFPPAGKEGRGKVVIEAFAGPGSMTRALLQLPPSRLRKLIVLESNEKLYAHVKSLEAHDPRVTALRLNSHEWDSYAKIEEEGLLQDVATQDWKHESELEFVATLPHTISGEQLTAQLLRAIPERAWLFKYGRMRMNMLIPDTLYTRIDAPTGKLKRCKLSVIAEATTRFHTPIAPAELRPYDDHFWPPSYIPRGAVPDSRKPGHPMVAITFDPLKKQVIHPGMLDKWDYCLRRLFVLKAYELQKALPSLAPGATNLVRYLHDPDVPQKSRVDLKQRVNTLTVKDWESIVKAFDQWPFAPDMLYIQSAFNDEKSF